MHFRWPVYNQSKAALSVSSYRHFTVWQFGKVPISSELSVYFLCVKVSESGVHRPHVAGIHGRSNDGAYSLVLAGGYEDDVVR